jgi:hypothetical protein
MTEHVKRTGPAVEAHYQFLLWLACAHVVGREAAKLPDIRGDDFDTKPVEMSRLLEKIEALKPH